MDSIEFIVIIAVLANILVWYVHNVRSGLGGHAGLFALRQDQGENEPAQQRCPDRPTVYVKKQTVDNRVKAAPSCSRHTPPQQRFRRQKEARYRVVDKAARYTPQKARPPR